MLLVLAGAGSVRVVRGAWCAWTDGAFPFIRSISIAISSRQIDESISICRFLPAKTGCRIQLLEPAKTGCQIFLNFFT
jgi:hypothetical protein